jgi:hypothetical protein
MRYLNARILSCVLLAATLVAVAPTASAHDVRFERYSYYEPPHRGHRYRAPLPHWLRYNYDFVRWYDLNRYSFAIDVSWKRLYRHYERDYHYHRHYKGHKKAYRYKGHGKKRKHKRHH